MPLKLRFETEAFIHALGRRGNALQITAADTLNESAEQLQKDYLRRLENNQIIRTNFTRNAVKVLKSNPIRRSGEPRPLHNINSMVVVRKLKGTDEHYLTKLEEGGRIKGNPKSKNRVPVPLSNARTGRNENKPIAGANRLTKNEPQTLRTPGGPIGVKGDGYRDPRRRFAVLFEYKRRGGGDLSGNLNKPFYFTDDENDLGIYKFMGNALRKIRTLRFKNLFRKSRPHFQKAFKKMTPSKIQSKFIFMARRALGRIK